MNIYDLNYLTHMNILFYKEEDPLLIFYHLLNDHLADALIVYEIYKWTILNCTSVPFLRWIREKKIKIELTKSAIKELLKQGVHEVLDYIHPCDYVSVILLSNSAFINYVFDHYTIVMEDYHIIEFVQEPIDKYDIFMTILSKREIGLNIIMDCLYYLCEYDESLLVKQLLGLYPMIIKHSLKPLFYKTLIYNHLELSLFFLSIDPTLVKEIEPIQLFINHSYKTLQWLYSLNSELFSNLNHNYIFDIIANHTPIVPEFIDWYISHFRNQIDNNLYEAKIQNLIFNGYCIGEISDEYFIHACTQNHLHIVKQYAYNYEVIEQGFGIAALFGYLDIVQYLCSYIEKTNLYKILHNLLELNCRHRVVSYITSQLTIHPPKFIYYLSDIGQIQLSDNVNEDCIYILCLNGHFSCFYELYINCRIEPYMISNAFIHACENGKGLFLAKWLNYTIFLSKKTIRRAFFNSNDIHTIKWLYSIEFIDLRKNNAYFIERCLNYDFVILDWLCEIFPNYSYTMVNGVVEYTIDLYKVSAYVEPSECCVCLETSNSMTLCKHTFCYDCINKWYKKNNSCPMCREPMNEVYSTLTTLAKLRGWSGLKPR